MLNLLKSTENRAGIIGVETTARARTGEMDHRPVAAIRTELESAATSAEPLQAKLTEVEGDLVAGRNAFDTEMEAFVLGAQSKAPSTASIEALVAKADALRRICGESQVRVARLKDELATAELADAVTQATKRMPSLLGAARTACANFEAAVGAVAKAELALSEALFSTTHGLRQSLPSAELRQSAEVVCRELRDQAMAAATRNGFLVDPDWELFGETNNGVFNDSGERWRFTQPVIAAKRRRHYPAA